MQVKRLSRVLPGALLASLILLGGLLLVFRYAVEKDSTGPENQRFRVAMVGYTDDPFLQMGLSALQGFDNSRLTLDIQLMESEQAREALSSGRIAAYVEIPEGFIEEARMGNIMPLKFVSTTGAAGLTSIVKDEVTDVIAHVLHHSQKGVYGMEHVVRDEGLRLGDNMTRMALQYTEYVLDRDKLYAVEELGIADALGLEGYLLCGLSVLFLMLCCLPYGTALIRKDMALQQMLRAGGTSAFGQAVAEFCAYVLCLFTMALTLLLVAKVFAGESFPLFGVLLRAIPVVGMAAAFSYMLCSLSSGLTEGLLLLFFSSLAMCFLSGCLYPIHMFPVSVQRAASWLPAGIARSLLAGCITETGGGLQALWLLLYTGGFFAVGYAVNARRIKGVSR